MARQLSTAKPAPAEEYVRTATGRAYYAAFLVARERLRTIGHHLPRDRSVHRYVIERLRRGGDQVIRGLGQNLCDLYEHRKDADYELAGRYRSHLAFSPAHGVLMATSAELWINTFSSFTDPALVTACPP